MRCSTLGRSRLTRKYYTTPEKRAYDERSSLFRRNFDDGKKVCQLCSRLRFKQCVESAI
jgi:hypothetical protein